MRKIAVALMALLFNILLFSCTNDAVSENDLLYETQSTEGEDGETDENPST